MRTTGALFNLAGAFLAGLLLLGAQPAWAGESLNGYRSAEFGMSVEQVRARLEGDGVTTAQVYETDDGDVIIDGRLAGDAGRETDVRYVFPGDRNQLALVLEFHPDSDDLRAVQARLEQSHGSPWAEDLAEKWFEQLKPGMPEGVRGLMVWGGGENGRNRFIRLWIFDDYLSVEYLHLGLLDSRS
jgi:hypothetical protein